MKVSDVEVEFHRRILEVQEKFQERISDLQAEFCRVNSAPEGVPVEMNFAVLEGVEEEEEKAEVTRLGGKGQTIFPCLQVRFWWSGEPSQKII
ncbi:hypothetical protein E2C01_047066 [Portunus trituberculatus]|uniref:Uncharacterized protein n=1 Tax=Portunus trituberculatus TaxID=210409 RepID=A0A5B7G6F7_PORTR|nr:hypothetical protein [Portunus trituberculatus]